MNGGESILQDRFTDRTVSHAVTFSNTITMYVWYAIRSVQRTHAGRRQRKIYMGSYTRRLWPELDYYTEYYIIPIQIPYNTVVVWPYAHGSDYGSLWTPTYMYKH